MVLDPAPRFMGSGFPVVGATFDGTCLINSEIWPISFKRHTGNNRVQRPLARRDVFE